MFFSFESGSASLPRNTSRSSQLVPDMAQDVPSQGENVLKMLFFRGRVELTRIITFVMDRGPIPWPRCELCHQCGQLRVFGVAPIHDQPAPPRN